MTSSTQASQKAGLYDQWIIDGADNSPVHFSVGITNRGDHREWRGDSIVYRLQTCGSVDKTDGVSYAFDTNLLQDMDKAMWYCSLDMASGFRVEEMTKRAGEISALN